MADASNNLSSDALDRLEAALLMALEAVRDLKKEANREAAAPFAIAKGVPADAPPRKCKGCGATIYFVETPNGRFMPTNADGTSHMDTCPQREEFKRR